MTIKKSIVGSLFSMLLGSEMVAADWGDTYFCKMTNFVNIKSDGEIEYFKLETFQFKLDQTKHAMVYGSTGYFKDVVNELVKGSNWPSQEWWSAIGPGDTQIYFKEGKFLYTFHGSQGSVAASADCDKF